MSELADWLLAQIAADEAAARAATPGPWYWEPETDESWPQGERSLRSSGKRETYTAHDGTVRHYDVEVVGSWGHDAWGTTAEDADRAHIARHDPARVLAECDAKRAIVTECKGWLDGASHHMTVESADEEGAYVSERVLRLLAQPYADAPGFRPEWHLDGSETREAGA